MHNECLKIFKNKSLKHCEKYVIKLVKYRNELEEIVQDVRLIPNPLLEDYQNTYKEFSKNFFCKKTINNIKKEKINTDILLLSIETTKKEIAEYKKELNNLNFIVLFLISGIKNSYMNFLDISDSICEDFIKNYKKFIL